MNENKKIIPQDGNYSEKTANEIKNDLVKVYGDMGCPDVFFLFEPASAENTSQEEYAKHLTSFLSEYNNYIKNPGVPNKFFEKADISSFKLK